MSKAVVGLTAWLTVASAAVAAENLRHMQVAEELVRQVQPENNHYDYHDPYISWGTEDGKYANNTDCSSFFNLLIGHVYGISPQQLKIWTGHKNPTAARWFKAISQQSTASFLQPVTDFGDAHPGDVIFVQYLDSSKDTGHVMIITSTPRAHEESAPAIAGTRQWEVDVIDSSKSGHGRMDTRYHSPKNYVQGVGQGTLRVYTAQDGAVAGYSWSLSSQSEFKPVSMHPVIVVRIVRP